MTQSLFYQLDDSKLTCPLTGNEYIPRQVVEEKITWPEIKELLPSTIGRQWIPWRDCNLESRIQTARNVIAILILMGRSTAIEGVLLQGPADEDLPLSRNGGELQSRSGRKIILPFAVSEPDAVGVFIEKQKLFVEPRLELGTAVLGNNIELDKRSPLAPAFSSLEEVTDTNTAYIYKAAHIPTPRYGVDDTEHGVKASPVWVAIKKFEPRHREEFDRETKILNTIHSGGVKNDHLIRQLAICDQAQCIIFPWADGGDLSEFWERAGPRRKHDFLWSLKQMLGLAHALESLHRLLKCRHGDLKPANILCFRENGDILKIADLGVARVHSVDTGLRPSQTTTTASTRAYEGPEAYISVKARSRRYDCWSMGCIILEFVVWLLHDAQALGSFRRARKWDHHKEYSYYRPKPATTHQNPEPAETTEIHPAVHEAMECLREDPRCASTALHDVVNLVDQKLLKIDPLDRAEAAELHKELQAIFERALNDPAYLVKAADSSVAAPLRPDVFSLPPSNPIQYTSH